MTAGPLWTPRVQMRDLAARLDTLCGSIEKGASWESAGHLRNRVLYALRAIARVLDAPPDTSSGVEILTLYRCMGCGTQYSDPDKAIACAAKGLPDRVAEPGDVVFCKGGYGWFDGDPAWVSNLADLTDRGVLQAGSLRKNPKHGNCFSSCCTYQFYYAVTAVGRDGHRNKYWLRTLAISGGHEGGYTYDDGSHHLPKRVNPMAVPTSVKAGARELIGKNVECLL